jgi:hypothetical protein
VDYADECSLWTLQLLVAELGDVPRIGVVLDLLDSGEVRLDEAVALLRWLH